jgi:protein-disulfide isomerase
VRDYILTHPEIIPEAVTRLQQREVAKAVAARRAQIETPFAGAWAGAADGDVVLVEYFDYACGYCRQSVADVERLLAEDKKLKVVWRELPVLGPPSEEAAKLSLAAAKQGQGKFHDFHLKSFAAGRPTPANLAATQKAAGIDALRASADARGADVTREIETNIAVARELGMTGTPSFVVGDKVMVGAVGYDALKAAIAEARKGR